ncbi:MAG TPA: N-acetylmuramoyl-L-alanine amidase [Myxococcota bacterium]|nr:N-acetylmuramoyl-L-alanine amidase [Myxococcota bacterium]HQI62387.1 N-acetylmuramoyl-L-alanine amidase [Myxococcota bacterium]
MLRFTTPVLALMLASQVAFAQQETRPLRVVLDPGHGGHNTGAIGVAGIHEKHLTLTMAKQVAALLEDAADVEIILTRTDDTFLELTERTDFAHKVDADIFISLHCNASESPEPHGIETFFLGVKGSDPEADLLALRENENAVTPAPATADPLVAAIISDIRRNGTMAESSDLAAIVQQSLIKSIPEAVSRKVRQANFAVLRHSGIPAIVVEVGFLTHPKEGLLLANTDYQARITKALATAIKSFASLTADEREAD